jgi:hypothetical protein
LLAGQPPRIARQRIQAATLEALSQGETVEASKPDRKGADPSIWLYMLGGLLGLSVLLNLILFLRR